MRNPSENGIISMAVSGRVVVPSKLVGMVYQRLQKGELILYE